MKTENTPRRLSGFGVAVLGSAVVMSGTLVAGGFIAANAEDGASRTDAAATTAPDAEAKLSREQRQADLKAKYGMYPLPVSVKSAKTYKLNKRDMRDIKSATALASSAKGQSVIECESNGSYTMNSGNGYYGAWQFDRQTWLANGGGKYAPTANEAPKFAQDLIMWKTHQSRGWRPWACA